jgi:hypothetical protein
VCREVAGQATGRPRCGSFGLGVGGGLASGARTRQPVPGGPGAGVWEVWFAFEVELLPCLNYVRAKP